MWVVSGIQDPDLDEIHEVSRGPFKEALTHRRWPTLAWAWARGPAYSNLGASHISPQSQPCWNWLLFSRGLGPHLNSSLFGSDPDNLPGLFQSPLLKDLDYTKDYTRWTLKSDMISGSSPIFTTCYLSSLNLISTVCPHLYKRMTAHASLGFGKYYIREYG